MKRSIMFAVSCTVGVLVLTTGSAQAATETARPGFGQHVSQCAQTMGFSGVHNPGMHHGAAGWDGLPC